MPRPGGSTFGVQAVSIPRPTREPPQSIAGPAVPQRPQPPRIPPRRPRQNPPAPNTPRGRPALGCSYLDNENGCRCPHVNNEIGAMPTAGRVGMVSTLTCAVPLTIRPLH